jgi:hemoglobin-like flavoprotein
MSPATSERIASFESSLRRCLASASFLDRFYELLIASSPEVGEKFRNTDFERQKKVVAESLFATAMAARDGFGGVVGERLRKIARRHSREQRDIRPELYDLWLDCLLRAVAEHDPEHSPEVERAWRETLSEGVAFMREHY